MKLNKDIRQRHLEKFEELYFDGTDRQGINTDRGAVVRAAIESGWYLNVPEGYDVAEEKPSVIRDMSKEVNDLYLDILKPDPNS